MNLKSKTKQVKSAAIATVVAMGLSNSSVWAVNNLSFTPTAPGTTYNWDNAGGQTNWGTSTGITYPNGAGDTANVNSDITGTVAIRLDSAVTLGTLNLGDAAASGGNFSFAVNNQNASGTSVISNTLTFQGLVAGDATSITLGSTGTPTNTIGANVILGGTSPLTINLPGTQSLTFSNLITTNNNSITVKGVGTGTVNISADLTGDATTVFNQASAGTTSLGNTVKTFAGTYNTTLGTLSIITGSGSASNLMTLAGNFNTAGTVIGGTLLDGGSSAVTVNPGQRVSSTALVLNGGHFSDQGQQLSGAALNSGLADTVGTVTFNSGYTQVTVANQAGASGNTFTATNLIRRVGATALVRSATLGGTAKFVYTNGTGVGAIGGGGDPTVSSQKNISILPWMMASNTNAFQAASTISDFAYYLSGVGFKALVSTQYDSTLVGSNDRNVLVGSVSVLTNDQTINSLKTNSASVGNIGTGKTLTIASGGINFGNTTAGIGGANAANAGTLAFGSVEAVVWANGANFNTIGSVITGSGGFTKAGTGTLTLTGANTYTGLTVVASGKLQVGNGTVGSHLGSTVIDSVQVANGATLQISSVNSLSDQATLILDQYGSLNGLVSIDTGLTETIGGFIVGGVQQAVGTWGSSASSAMFKNDTYFSGTGVLNVTATPEPSSIALFSIAGIAALRRRRR